MILLAVAKLFHSLVVLGAGISGAACGGTTTISSGGTPDHAAGSGNGGAGAGGVRQSSGGRSGVGGQLILIGTGGIGTGGSFDAGSLPDAGTLAQWACSPYLLECGSISSSGLTSFLLRTACTVHPELPRSAADCRPSELFECYVASFQGREVLVNCDCTPKSDAGECYCVSPRYEFIPAQCSDHSSLCGCAFTGIAH
jgi:hypothetical protein